MPEAQYFFDTVCLSNFALSGSLDLLVQRYGTRLWVTSEVQDELSAGVACGYATLQTVLQLIAERVFSSRALTAKERGLYTTLISHLGPGEASCIVSAVDRVAVVVTDDRAARTVCDEHRIPYTGTVGILKALCLDGSLTCEEADTCLGQMVQEGFYSPVRRIRDVL